MYLLAVATVQAKCNTAGVPSLPLTQPHWHPVKDLLRDLTPQNTAAAGMVSTAAQSQPHLTEGHCTAPLLESQAG